MISTISLDWVRRLRSGWRGETAVVTGSFVLINFARILSTVTLTRLLAPEVFGVIGVLSALAYTVTMVSDVGFQAFVIRHEEGDDKRFRNVIWTIRLGRSVILTIVLFLLGAPIASLIAKPELVVPIQVFSIFFFLEGLTSLAIVSAYRNRQLVRLNAVELIGVIAQLIFSVAFALIDPTYWAIIAAMLVSASVKTVLTYLIFPDSRQTLAFDRRYAAELFSFARFITGSSIITLLISQTDKLVLSRLFSLDLFGLYVIATSLTQVPIAFANSYANQILYPRFASVWRNEPAAMGTAFYSTKRFMHHLYMLAVGGLIGAAPLVIEILYDDRYRAAATYLSLLSISSLFALSNMAMMVALVATGKPQVTFLANLARLIWFGLLIPGGWLLLGPIGVVVAVATAEIPAMIYNWRQMHRAGLLSPAREAGLIIVAVVGVALGWTLRVALMPLVQYLA